MPSVRRFPLAALTLAVLAAPVAALADPPRSDSDPCRGRHAGDPCEADDFEGTCRSRRCTRETDDGLHTSRCLVCESRRRGHGHHRRHRDAAAEDDATVADGGDDASADVAADVSADVAADAPARRDAAAVARPAAPPPKEGLFACAARPQGGGGGAGWAGLAAWALTACSSGRRRSRRARPRATARRPAPRCA